MKTFLLSVACALVLGSQAFAATPNYKCIADRLQATNSDIYYNLSPAEIDALIADTSHGGHNLVVKTVANCEAELYQCIADGLQASNSDIFYALTKEEVQVILTQPAAIGHNQAVFLNDYCRK